ncbi:aldo/keto reductase [Streptomyces sp. NPDC026589]|uniref:aldo/keto reductase n=1 Tax=Streptomyces sp. NPDC026589 TaxID=3155609 RepID=UPI00340652A5
MSAPQPSAGAGGPLPTRRLGPLEVSAQGLGGMAMTEVYGPVDEAEAVRAVHRALDLGVTLLDTSDVYGHGRNEELFGKALSGHRDQAVVATKYGVVRHREDRVGRGVRGDAPFVRQACDASLRRLGIDHIDLWFQNRVDATVPVEETIGAAAELVRAGKVRHLGLSEAGPETIRRAHAVHPIAALQTEWALWSRDIEREAAPVCRELGIGIVAYAPLGRGLLAGSVPFLSSLGADDYRRTLPRFAPGNFERNAEFARALARRAALHGLTSAQLALAWVHHRGPDVVPIPGSKRPTHVAENTAAVRATLTAEELRELEELVPAGQVAGERYPESSMRMLNL